MWTLTLLFACAEPESDNKVNDPPTEDSTPPADSDSAPITELEDRWVDADNDGYGDPDRPVQALPDAPGTADNDDDCNDLGANIRPDAQEICNNLDDDCDTRIDDADDSVSLDGAPTWYADQDGDGAIGDSPVVACAPPAGGGPVERITDCDDEDPNVHPGASEVCEDGLDNDCDGTPNGCRLTDSDTSRAVAVYPGRARGDGAGESVLILDLDGDGDGELLIGAPGAEVDPLHTGEVTGWTGDERGTVDPSVSLGAINLGTGEGLVEAGVGASLARWGDLDGDGLDEWMVGGPGYRGHPGSFGVFSAGSTFPTAALAVGLGTGAAECGYAVAGGADLSGDGAPDGVVGCPRDGRGVVRVYESLDVWRDVGSNSDSDGLGGAVSVDDFDGDGLADLVAGAMDDDQVLWFAGPIVDGLNADDADGANLGPNQDGTVASVGDLTDDGYPDLVIGAAQAEVGRFYEGGADLLDGSLNMGEMLNDAASGDLDGDGYRDVILGDQAGDGQVKIFFGPVSLSFEDPVTLRGGSLDHFGDSLSVGDVDGDGLDDLLVGGTGSGAGGVASGAAWLFLGVGM